MESLIKQHVLKHLSMFEKS